MAAPLCDAEGIELVHIEYRRESGGLILRIYIDKPGGVTLNDCTGISRQLNDLLDIQVEEMPPYTLEVSSPGVDRPLVKKEDYERFVGSRANIKLTRPVKGQKNFKGTIQGVDDRTLILDTEDGSIDILLDDILKARLDVSKTL